jgi:hypothetical protein
MTSTLRHLAAALAAGWLAAASLSAAPLAYVDYNGYLCVWRDGAKSRLTSSTPKEVRVATR